MLPAENLMRLSSIIVYLKVEIPVFLKIIDKQQYFPDWNQQMMNIYHLKYVYTLNDN